MDCEYKDCPKIKNIDFNIGNCSNEYYISNCENLKYFKAGQSSGEAKEMERCVGLVKSHLEEYKDIRDECRVDTNDWFRADHLYMLCVVLIQEINRLGE